MGAVVAVRERTKAAHARLESSLAIAQPSAGTRELHIYLEHLYGWLVPRDAWTWARPWPAALHPHSRLRKRDWLEADLHTLRGLTDATAARDDAAEPPAAEDELDLLASAYVLEGSMLGGRVLRRRFQRAGFESRFFEGYGNETGALWASLLSELESVADTHARQARLADAAERVFEDLCEWMQTSTAVWT